MSIEAAIKNEEQANDAGGIPASMLTARPAEQPGAVGLRRFQREVFNDPSRFIAWVKSRQIGGSWCVGAKVADSAIADGEDWVVLSRGLRQSKRLLKKIAVHILAMDKIRVQKYGAPTLIEHIGTEQIELKNGAAIMAMPCDDETTVGDAANVLMDEFALFQNSEAVFEALSPCIMNGFRIIVLSTPRGVKNMFAKIFQGADNGWSKHKTTLFDAEAGGLVLRDHKGRRITAQEFLDDLRRKGMSEKAIRQEFLCEFIDEATAFLTLDMIRAIQDPLLPKVIDWRRLKYDAATFFVGIDIGRFNDPTVIWLWELCGEALVCRGCEEHFDTPFPIQEKRVREILEHRSVRRCCIDASGMGIDIAERLQNTKGPMGSKIEPCTFTEGLKEELAAGLRSKVERHEILIPADDAIATDWHSIEQAATERGRLRYTASRSTGSHADRFWAAALGIHASRYHKPFKLVMSFGDN